jgi:hypothetical protein
MHKVIVPLLFLLVLALAAFGGYSLCGGSSEGYVVLRDRPAQAAKVAFVRERLCDTGRCQTLWIGETEDTAVEVSSLAGSHELVEEIAWAEDGYRVGFVVNGYQLRIFDGNTREQVGVVDLIDAQGTPTTRMVRGVTFSETGAAVTFDDCPRSTSGCKSGLAAVR